LVEGKLRDPQSLNQYVYCLNNPHKYTDPDSRFWHVVAGVAVGAVVNGAVQATMNCMQGRDLFQGWETAAVTGAISGGFSAASGMMVVKSLKELDSQIQR
jgi:uncharacterized protein YcfJ